MRLLRCISLLVAVTSALLMSNTPKRSADPTVPGSVDGLHSLVGPALDIGGLSAAAWLLKNGFPRGWTKDDQIQCEKEATDFWDQFFSAFEWGELDGFNNFASNILEACKTRESAAKLRAYFKQQKEAYKKSQRNTNVPEPEVMVPQKMKPKINQTPATDNTSPDSSIAVEEPEPQPDSNGIWNNIAGVVGSGITAATLGIAAGRHILGGDGSNAMGEVGG